MNFVPSHIWKVCAGNVEGLAVESSDLQIQMKMIENFNEAEYPKRTRDDQAKLSDAAAVKKFWRKRVQKKRKLMSVNLSKMFFSEYS